MQTSTKCYILLAVVVVLGCVYGGLYWYACEHPLSSLAERMLSPEKRAEKLATDVSQEAYDAVVAVGKPSERRSWRRTSRRRPTMRWWPSGNRHYRFSSNVLTTRTRTCAT